MFLVCLNYNVVKLSSIKDSKWTAVIILGHVYSTQHRYLVLHIFFIVSFSVLSHAAPPKVSGPPETPVSVLRGQPVAIECDLEGRPKPDYIWMHNGDEVTSDDIVVMENLLTIER